jgi:hypothetical protein
LGTVGRAVGSALRPTQLCTWRAGRTIAHCKLTGDLGCSSHCSFCAQGARGVQTGLDLPRCALRSICVMTGTLSDGMMSVNASNSGVTST